MPHLRRTTVSFSPVAQAAISTPSTPTVSRTARARPMSAARCGANTTTGGFVTSTPTVANGVVYALSSGGILDAFDATGVTNCSGKPESAHRCGPLAPAVGNRPSTWSAASSTSAGSFIEAFSANGSTNCAARRGLQAVVGEHLESSSFPRRPSPTGSFTLAE